MNSETLFTSAIIGFLALILIFLAFRELNTWYWKINERIRLQQETNELLQKMIRQNENKPDSESSA